MGGFQAFPNDFLKFYTKEEIETARIDASRALEILEKDKDLRFISILDERYPASLRNIYDPPPGLYICGADLDGEFDAIVGTRAPSPVVRCAVRILVRSLSSMIVSGFARGVDAEAHLECARGGRRTIAVLGSGHRFAGPGSTLRLLRPYSDFTTFVSEFPPHWPARSHSFPRRNRIIAGLSARVFLMQAPAKSGALITARYALEEGRDLICFDHPVLETWMNEGARRLIQEGATLLEIEALDSLFVRPPGIVWPPGNEQLEFFEKRQRGLLRVSDTLYIEEV